MSYIYGPIQSRRLGLSLGISLTPPKVCSFDCIYCQAGKTTFKTIQQKEYVLAKEVLEQLHNWLKENPQQAKKLSYITFSGTGEPTLNSAIGKLIEEIKKLSSVPIALITNASLLSKAEVRKEIIKVDLIVPSLDAVEQDIFERIDQPYPSIKIEEVINGLIQLRKEYSGKIWLEVMLVEGINDAPKHISKLAKVITEINPDKIQLNSPVRCPVGCNCKPLSNQKLLQIKQILGSKAEII
ncbi:MAG: radical SAM protein [Candidatus Omnitrophica bacterium]|nr:radical SAM protein [Candidatus Omnitrophota bacterium]